MERSEMTKELAKRLNIDAEKAEVVLNEVLATRVIPDVFRQPAVERIASVARVEKDQAERAINQFVGMVTSRAALFEEVIRRVTEAGISNDCDSCRGCFNCGKAALSQLVTQPGVLGL